MAHLCNDVETGRNKKHHKKKKKAVHDTDEKHMHTVSDLCEVEDKGKLKDTVIKFHSSDNADISLESMLSDSAYHETVDFAVKLESGKKRKRLHNEAKRSKIKRGAAEDKSKPKDKEKMSDTVNKFDSTDNAQESRGTTDSVVKRKGGKKRKWLHDEAKKNKTMQGAENDKSADANTKNTDTAASSCVSQYHALEYLRNWKLARDHWTFQKVRQVWLLQHIYDATKVTACSIFSLDFLFKKYDSINLWLVCWKGILCIV